MILAPPHCSYPRRIRFHNVLLEQLTRRRQLSACNSYFSTLIYSFKYYTNFSYLLPQKRQSENRCQKLVSTIQSNPGQGTFYWWVFVYNKIAITKQIKRKQSRWRRRLKKPAEDSPTSSPCCSTSRSQTTVSQCLGNWKHPTKITTLSARERALYSRYSSNSRYWGKIRIRESGRHKQHFKMQEIRIYIKINI